MATDFPDATSVRVRRTFRASTERAWRAHTDPGEMAQWMWAGWGSETQADADVRVGGRYEVYMTPPSADANWPAPRWGFFGYYTEVAAPRRLGYTLHWDAPVGYNLGNARPADEVVLVEIQAADEGCAVVRWHMGIPSIDGAAAEHGRGIEAEFDALEQLLAGR